MAELILMRHASALPAASDANDFERPLTPQGREACARAARQLAAAGVKVQRLLYSPARRSRDTAALVAGELSLEARALQPVPDLYGASASVIRHTLQRLHGGAATLMIVAHNPGISEFGRALASALAEDYLPPAGLWRLPFDRDSWGLLTAGDDRTGS